MEKRGLGNSWYLLIIVVIMIASVFVTYYVMTSKMTANLAEQKHESQTQINALSDEISRIQTTASENERLQQSFCTTFIKGVEETRIAREHNTYGYEWDDYASKAYDEGYLDLSKEGCLEAGTEYQQARQAFRNALTLFQKAKDINDEGNVSELLAQYIICAQTGYDFLSIKYNSTQIRYSVADYYQKYWEKDDESYNDLAKAKLKLLNSNVNQSNKLLVEYNNNFEVLESLLALP